MTFPSGSSMTIVIRGLEKSRPASWRTRGRWILSRPDVVHLIHEESRPTKWLRPIVWETKPTLCTKFRSQVQYKVRSMFPALEDETKYIYRMFLATMKVYQDFFVYKSGVYRHSTVSESYPTGYHSVRIVGWGEELSIYGPSVKYWVN